MVEAAGPISSGSLPSLMSDGSPPVGPLWEPNKGVTIARTAGCGNTSYKCAWACVCIHVYSGPSDGGLSQIRTQYNKPLYKGHDLQSHEIHTIHFEPPKEESLSTKNKSAKFLLSPKCPLFGGTTAKCTTTYTCINKLRHPQNHNRW